MSGETKSGKEIVSEFFAEIRNLEGVDKKTVDKLISLYNRKKLTDTNVCNAMEELLREELNDMEEKDGEN